MAKKDFAFDIKDVKEDGTFEGYGSTFGGEPDSYGDIIVEGAFKKTLMQNGDRGFGISMLWQHDSRQIPGVWTDFAENSKGLFAVGKLALETQLGHDAHVLMKMKPPAIKGLSIGFRIPKGGYEYDNNIKYIKEISLGEISLVTFPANINAQVTGVKSVTQMTERELETCLRDLGMSKKDSLQIVSMCKNSLRDSDEQKDNSNELGSILDALKEANSKIK